MTINFENVLFMSGASGATTKRTPAARCGDIINVLDFGADPTGANDSTTAIRGALTALWGNAKHGSTLFFPPGDYKVTDTIDISDPNIGSNNTNGRIAGAAKNSVFIHGLVNNGFIFMQPDSTNGPGEIAHLTISNDSTWIGSGALMLNNSSCVFNSCHFAGMICVLMPFNIYNAEFNNCTGGNNPDATTGYAGTLGIAGYGCSISNWRTANPFYAAIQVYGANAISIRDCGIENCTVGILLGMRTGFAGSCTVSGNILTVGGTLGTTVNKQFDVNSHIFGRGLTSQAWGASPFDSSGVTIIDDHSTDGTLTGAGFAGTYRISASATISTPIPIWSRAQDSVTATFISGVAMEACYYPIFVSAGSGIHVTNSGCGSQAVECVSVFGVPGYCPHSGIYLMSAAASVFSACVPSANTYAGNVFIDPNANLSNVSFINCVSTKAQDITTDSGATIDNTGKMTINSVISGSAIGIGMSVTGSGVTAGTVITGNHSTDGTLTGGAGAGTYRVNNTTIVSATTLTIHTGADWVMPTATASKAGLKFINCGATIPAGVVSGLNNLGMTFTCLPGQAGASNNVQLVEGQTFDIVDGQKSGGGTALFGDTVAGGGGQHISVRYNGTGWTRNG